jgi:hypothetical protein
LTIEHHTLRVSPRPTWARTQRLHRADLSAA